jgi:hypothetical protein
MLFAFLVFLAAFGIEGIGTYVSVVGLSAIFAASPVVIVLSVALDYGKVMAVSFLYKHWSSIKWPMKVYMTLATIVLVSITSAGAFGFLSGEFQKAIADTGTQAIKIQTLEEEKGRLQKRKEEIDAQIAKVADNNVRGRTQLIKQFGPEVNRVNGRLAEIDTELPDLKIKNIDKELHVGPIMYVAKAFNTTPEEAVKWVILTIMIVFDPLAISLLIAGNFLLELNRKKKEQVAQPSQMMEHINVGGKTFNYGPEFDTHSEKDIDKVYEDFGFTKEDRDRIVGELVAEQEAYEEAKRAEAVKEAIAENPHGYAEIKPTITADQMELVPVEELQTPAQDPDCAYCGGDGDHHVGPGVYVPCNACTPEEDLQSSHEEEAVVQPTTPSPRITMKEKDGRDVIALSTPRSALEDVSTYNADIVTDNTTLSNHSVRLRNHYIEEPAQADPVVVGNPK